MSLLLGEDTVWANYLQIFIPGSKCLLIFLIFQNKFLDYEKRKVRMNTCKCFVCRIAPLFLSFPLPLPSFSAKTECSENGVLAEPPKAAHSSLQETSGGVGESVADCDTRSC